jgi:hypothetical protein
MALSAKEKQKAYRARVKAKKAIQAKRSQSRAVARLRSDPEIEGWTDCRRSLDGLVEPDRPYASYGPDGFIYVSPSIGPICIQGEAGLEAFNRATNWGYLEELGVE